MTDGIASPVVAPVESLGTGDTGIITGATPTAERKVADGIIAAIDALPKGEQDRIYAHGAAQTQTATVGTPTTVGTFDAAALANSLTITNETPAAVPIDPAIALATAPQNGDPAAAAVGTKSAEALVVASPEGNIADASAANVIPDPATTTATLGQTVGAMFGTGAMVEATPSPANVTPVSQEPSADKISKAMQMIPGYEERSGQLFADKVAQPTAQTLVR